MKAAITTIVKGVETTVYTLGKDNNAHITTPLTVSGGVSEGSPYGEDICELSVVVLTPEQKAAVEAVTGTAYDYYDGNDNIPDGENVTIYADAECTQKVGTTVKTEYIDNEEEVISGDLFNLQAGESISAGTYYAREERGSLGNNSHAEGNVTTASGTNSHAEGNKTIASGGYSHAEGNETTARGYGSHAEGSGTTASGNQSHAEGNRTIASGNNSHAEGNGTIASQINQHVCGQFNVEDAGNTYQLIVGNGSDKNNRHNAFAVTKAGELVLFKADGTPVILNAATLETLIASV